MFFAISIALAGTVAGLWIWHEGRRPTPVIRGSPTTEFATTRQPKPEKRELGVSWPTYGYDLARTHVAPVGFKLRPPFRRLWMMRAGYYVEFPPSVAYGNVYIGQLKGRLFAVNGRTGKVAWKRSFGPFCTFASPTISRGLLYQTFLPAPCDYGPRGHPGFTVALRASDGKEMWRYRGPASESAVLVHGRTLYFGSWDHHLYALDIRRKRPRLRWKFEADDELNSSPAYAGGTIFIGSDGGHVYAIDARTGKARWRAAAFGHFGKREYFYATPAIAYGRVYIGNTDGTVYAFGAGTGHLLWTQHAGTYVYTAAAVWKKTVYVGSYDGNVYALDAATGDIRWKRDLGASIHGAPTIMDGLIYFSTCGTCGHRGSRYAKMGPRSTFALDARTGRIRWRFFDGRYSPIVSDGERVYLMGNTRLYGFAPTRRRGKVTRRISTAVPLHEANMRAGGVPRHESNVRTRNLCATHENRLHRTRFPYKPGDARATDCASPFRASPRIGAWRPAYPRRSSVFRDRFGTSSWRRSSAARRRRDWVVRALPARG